MAEGPGADSPGEGLPFLLPLGQPGLPQGQAQPSPSYLAGERTRSSDIKFSVKYLTASSFDKYERN